MPLGDFSAQADAYRTARPTYPPLLIDLLCLDADVEHGDPVADFGAGTGILTRLLLERGLSVTALEPNEPMRQQADLPQARWIDGTFEDSKLPSESQAWAVAAQAFHWAHPPRSLPEIRRILQPGKLFTILWNRRLNDRSAILQWTEAAIQRHVPEYDPNYRDKPWQEILVSTGDFTFVNRRAVEHLIPMSRERYLQLWQSQNRLNTIAGPERFAAFLRDLENHLQQEHDELIEVPYICEAWAARRVD